MKPGWEDEILSGFDYQPSPQCAFRNGSRTLACRPWIGPGWWFPLFSGAKATSAHHAVRVAW